MANDASAPTIPTSSRLQWIARGLDWLTARERYILALGVAFQVVFLLAMMVQPLMTLATGDTFLLRVVPIDPRDIFRGDYVTLNYDISRPGWGNNQEANWANAERMPKQGQPIYALLEPEEDGKHWRYSRYQIEPPTEGKFIRGAVQGFGSVEYGIEQFFVQEGQGHDYEQAAREKKLSAEVVIDKNGAAQIKRLVIE
jgi:uncharacterized membrane-anchored protein